MRSVSELQKICSEIEFDPEEYAESLVYEDFLHTTKRAELSYPLTDHPLYQTIGPDEVVDRRRIKSVPGAFNSRLSPSEFHWQSRTSGTSGAPLELIYSSRCYFFNLFEPIPRSLALLNIDLREQSRQLHVFLTDNPGHSLAVRIDPRNPTTAYLTVPLGSDGDWSRTLMLLERLQPDTLASKPNLFQILLSEPRLRNLVQLNCLKAIISSGANLSADLKAHVQSEMHVPIANSYNISEAGYLGAACHLGKIHLSEQHNQFQVLTEKRVLCAEGVGDLVVTSELNDCMPLRNYLVGDRVDLRTSACECGRPGSFLQSFEGRSVPLFTYPSGLYFSPTRWMKIFDVIPDIQEFQLTQKSDLSLEVKIESLRPLAQFNPEVRRFLAANLLEKMEIRILSAEFDKNTKLQRFRREYL